MGDLGKLLVAKGYKELPKSNKSHNLVTLKVDETRSIEKKDFKNKSHGAQLNRESSDDISREIQSRGDAVFVDCMTLTGSKNKKLVFGRFLQSSQLSCCINCAFETKTILKHNVIMMMSTATATAVRHFWLSLFD